MRAHVQASGPHGTRKRPCGNWLVLPVLVLALLSAPAFGAKPAYECNGENYRRTMGVIDYAQSVGYEVGATGDIGLLYRRLQEISAYAKELPDSCQLLLQQMSGAFNSSAGGTTCMSGVCCDGTGCY